MKKKSHQNTLLAIATVAFLSACASNDMHATKVSVVSAAAPLNLSMLSFSAATAGQLILSDPAQFQSAALLASQRGLVKQEISEMTLGITSEGDEKENISVIKVARLPTGLDYFEHNVTDLTEKGITLSGAAIALYLNSRFPYFQGKLPTAPDQLRLLSGRLYSADSAYVIEMKNPDGQVSTQECSPEKIIPASTVHAKLEGRAVIFHCTLSGETGNFWYLENYRRYVEFELFDDGELLSRKTIKDVKFN